MNIREVTTAIETREIRGVALVVGLVLLYVATSVTASSAFVHAGIARFDPAVGLVVPFSVAFGVPGAVAGALGVLARDLLHGTADAVTAVVTVAHLLAGLLAYRLARQVIAPAERRSVRGWVRWVGGFCLVATVAAAASTAAIGWGTEVLAIAPFYLAAVTFLQYVLATIVLGLPFLAVLEGTTGSVGSAHPGPGGGRFVRRTAAVAIGWLAAGVLGSLGFRNLVLIPAWALHDVGAGFLVALADPGLFGRGAVRVQSVLAGVAISLLVALLVADRRDTGVQG